MNPFYKLLIGLIAVFLCGMCAGFDLGWSYGDYIRYCKTPEFSFIEDHSRIPGDDTVAGYYGASNVDSTILELDRKAVKAHTK